VALAAETVTLKRRSDPSPGARLTTQRTAPFRLHVWSHRFDALAVAREQQASATESERCRPIGMAGCHRDGVNIGGEPRLIAV
jgi:hypothetical protein